MMIEMYVHTHTHKNYKAIERKKEESRFLYVFVCVYANHEKQIYRSKSSLGANAFELNSKTEFH